MMKSEHETKLLALFSEIDSIHHSNVLYWKDRNQQSRQDREEYQNRQNRLQAIRAELGSRKHC